MIKKILFRHTCDICGKERPVGTRMDVIGVFRFGSYKHVYTCEECPQESDRTGKVFSLPSLRGIFFY